MLVERELVSEKQEFFHLLQQYKIFTPPMAPNLVCKKVAMYN